MPAATKKKRRGRLSLDIARRVLPNGLICLATRNDAAPTVALTCSFQITQCNEDARQAGIAQLTGELLDEGTERYDAEKLAEMVEGLGAELSCSGAGVSMHLASQDYGKALRILKELLLKPTFPAASVRRAKSLAIASIQSDEEEPRTVAGKRFRELVYGKHPYGRPAKGSEATISRVTRAQIVSFHKKWFTPDNATIAVVGKLDPEEMLDLLEKSFRSWKGKAGTLVEESFADKATGVVREDIDFRSMQSQVFLGHLGVTRQDPDFYKLVVMDHILGTGPGFTDRISRKLRDEMGLCYAVGASISNSAGLRPGVFSAYIGTSPNQVDLAIEGFLAEMHRIRKELPGKQELADVAAYLTGSFVWALERSLPLARFLIRMDRFDLGSDYVARYPELIQSVTPEEVREAARGHLDPMNHYVVTLGPAS